MKAYRWSINRAFKLIDLAMQADDISKIATNFKKNVNILEFHERFRSDLEKSTEISTNMSPARLVIREIPFLRELLREIIAMC